MAFSHSDFRHCLGRFSTGVSVILTNKDKKTKQGVTVSSFCSVSLEPPMILFCLDRTSFVHQTFFEAEHITINLLSQGQENLSRTFAHPSSVNWPTIGFKDEEALVLEDCLAYLQCNIAERYEGGDHTIFLARVKNVWTDPAKEPLLYYRGHYYHIGDTV